MTQLIRTPINPAGLVQAVRDDLALGTGAGLVGITNAGTGGVLRTVFDKLGDFVTSLDFMTAAQRADVRARTLTLDVTAAVQAALTSALLQKKPLLVIAGAYRLSAKLVGSGAFVRVVGDGSGLVDLVWFAGSTGGGGLDLTYTSYLRPAVVRGLCLQTKAAAVGSALKITGELQASVTNIGPETTDIIMRGFDPTTSQCWARGKHFKDCWYVTCTDFAIDGYDDGVRAPLPMEFGVVFENCLGFYFGGGVSIFHTACAIGELDTGANRIEGFQLDKFELVGVGYGVVFTSPATSGVGTVIGAGHINAYFGGIHLTRFDQVSLHDQLYYKAPMAGASWVGLQLLDCDSVHAHDLEMHGSATTTGLTTGVLLTGSTGVTNSHIHDNQFQGFTGAAVGGIVLGTGCTRNRVHDNWGDANLGAGCVRVNSDAGTGNILHDNLPTTVQVLQTNSATPSVANALHARFNTANSVSTTYTDFPGGAYVGQVITVLVNDGWTAFQHNGTKLKLSNNTSWAAPNGATLTLQLDTVGGLWREIGRAL